jgi:predicted RNA binding protein YcfA (HicA-like mRNA interferase family)
MPRLRRLSGAELVKILREFGFTVHSQRGSHIKLRRVLPGGASQTLTVPAHETVKLGTLHAIFTQAARFIPEEELRRHFYTD